MPDARLDESLNAGEVTLRRLPEGSPRRAVERSSNGRHLELELADEAAEFSAGTLAEIETSQSIYLGEIRRREGFHLWVAVEHALDRARLRRIQELWNEAEAAEAAQS